MIEAARCFRLALGSMLVASIAGCREPAPTPRAGPYDPATAHGGPSNGGTYYVAYRFDPEPIRVGQPFAMDVWVLGGADTSRPVGGVNLRLDARMPVHEFGLNQPALISSRGPGRFRVSNLVFHMAGRWEIYFDITSASFTERAQFDIRLE